MLVDLFADDGEVAGDERRRVNALLNLRHPLGETVQLLLLQVHEDLLQAATEDGEDEERTEDRADGEDRGQREDEEDRSMRTCCSL